MSIQEPNYTMMPNDLFDHWLKFLNGEQLRVLVSIIRKEFGWEQAHGGITVAHLAKHTGLLEQSVTRALDSLSKRHVPGIDSLLELVRFEEVQE